MPEPQGLWTDPITGITYQGRPWWWWLSGAISGQGIVRGGRTTPAPPRVPSTPSWMPRTPRLEMRPYTGQTGALYEYPQIPVTMQAQTVQEERNKRFYITEIGNLVFKMGLDPLNIGADPDTLAQSSLQEVTQKYNDLTARVYQQFNPQSTQGRQNLSQAVMSGRMSQEEAFGANSQWNKWQNQQADIANQKLYGAQAGATPGYAGAEESQGAALTRWGQAEIQGQKTREAKMEEARRLMGEMPDWAAKTRYGQYQPTGYASTTYQGVDPAGGGQSYPITPGFQGAQGGYQSPGDVETGRFIQLMDTPEFQKAYSDYRYKMLEDYGTLFSSYEKAGKILPETGEYKPFPDWIQAIPSKKLQYEAQRFEKEAPVRRPVPTWR